MSSEIDPKTAAEGDREYFEQVRAQYDEGGFDGPTEFDHERNRIIGFLLDAYDRLHVENQHLRDTDRDRDVQLERLEAECDRLGAASVAIGESWRKRTEKAEEELAAVKKSLTRPDEQPQDERDGDVRAVVELREQLALVSDQAEHAVDLLARTIGSTPCRLDCYGDCDAHGFQGIEAGEQCPHALARAFLAGAGRNIAALDARDAKGGEGR